MSEPKIYAAMNQVMRGIGAVGKDQKNQQQGFMFRGIDQVYNALHRLMAEAGVFSTSSVLSDERQERTTPKGGILAFTRVKIKYTFHALDGSTVETEVIGEGMDSGDKSTNKAFAIAHKYALLQAFMVPTEQIDPDQEVHEITATITQNQIDTITTMAGEVDADIEKMLAWLKVDRVDEIPASRYKAVIAMLERKARA